MGCGMMNELYLIPDFDRIEDSVGLLRTYGAYFEYNDFYNPSLLDDKKWVKKRIDFYKKLGFSECSQPYTDEGITMIPVKKCISAE